MNKLAQTSSISWHNVHWGFLSIKSAVESCFHIKSHIKPEMPSPEFWHKPFLISLALLYKMYMNVLSNYMELHCKVMSNIHIKYFHKYKNCEGWQFSKTSNKVQNKKNSIPRALYKLNRIIYCRVGFFHIHKK